MWKPAGTSNTDESEPKTRSGTGETSYEHYAYSA